MYYFTISNGMPGYLPNQLDYYKATTIEAANVIIEDAIAEFCSDDYAHRAIDYHGMGASGGSASMWSRILAFANYGTEELRVEGLTEAEFLALEAAEMVA